MPDDEELAWAVVGLLDIPVRDLLIARLCPGTLSLDVFPVALRRLAESELPARDALPTSAGRGDRHGARRLPERLSDAQLAQLTALADLCHLSELPGLPELPELSGLSEVADDDEVTPGDGRLVEQLAMVCRRSPPELSPGPLTVLGHVVWWLGDGALARTAVEQALEVDPDYRLAVLLERMVDVAVRPRCSA